MVNKFQKYLLLRIRQMLRLISVYYGDLLKAFLVKCFL